ncbi:MAG: hypothetical protein OXU50_04460, partial [Gammaproteobacteria bacterium]|nr:hypothetical protein [Gammaproteobacteria bacterium]
MAASAQTAGTVTFSATGSGGDRDATAPGLQINEGDSVTLTVTANGLTAGRVLGTLNYGGGTATYGQNQDYIGPNVGGAQSSFDLTHPTTTQAFTITTRDDSDLEGEETFVFSYSGSPVGLGATPASWSSGAPLTITVTILGNDGNAFSIAAEAASVAENAGNVIFTVAMVGDALVSGESRTVDWAASGSGITSGDIGATSGTLTFTETGEQSLNIALTDDADAESDEPLTITLSNPSGGAVLVSGASSASTTILANDQPGTLTIAATGSGGDRDSTTAGLQVDEGDTITVTMTAHGKTAGVVRGQLAVTGTATNSATLGDFDVSNLGGILVRVETGATEGSLNFRVNDDSHREGDETVIFTIGAFDTTSNPMPATWSLGSPSSVTVTILASDNELAADATATLSASVNGGPACTDCRANEGDSLAITLTLTPGAGAIGFNSESFGGTATQGEDYTGVRESGVVVWPTEIFNAGTGYSDTNNYMIVNDTTAEPDETMTLEVPSVGQNPGNLAVARGAPITITILASDGDAASFAGTATIVANQTTVGEGAGATFTVSLSGAEANAVATASFTVAGGSADAADYDIAGFAAAATAGEIGISAGADGAGSATIVLNIADDSAGEGPETLQVNLRAGGGVAPGSPSSAVTTINRSDVAVGFERTSYLEREDVGQFQVCVEVSNPSDSQPLDDEFSLAASTRMGTAGGGDFTAITNQIIGPFTNDTRRRCIAVEITDSAVPENTENFFIDLAPPPGGTLAGAVISPSQATVNIEDDDTITVGWAQASSNVTVNEASGTVVLTAAVLSPAPGDTIERSDFSLAVSTIAGSAGGADYTALTNQSIGPFGNNARVATATITINDDSVSELTESFSARLGFVLGQPVPVNTDIAPATAAVAIIDNELPSVVVAADQAAVSEGGTATFTVSLAGVVAAGVTTVSFTVSGGSADAGDYDIAGLAAAATTGEVVITSSAGSAGSATIALNITDDSAAEGGETLQINLLAPAGFMLGDPSSAAVIINYSDVVVGFERTSYLEREDVGQFQVCVNVIAPTLSQPLPGASFSVAVSTEAGSAGGADYTAITNQRAGPFGDSRRSECFLVEIIDDAIPENAETFPLALSSPPGTTLDGLTISPSRATVTIEDDDTITIGWAQASSNVTVSEASGTVVLTAAILSPATDVAIERDPLSLGLSTMDGGAVAGADYTAPGTTIGPFGDDNRSVAVTIAITDDSTAEALAESFTANLGFVPGTPVPPNTAVSRTLDSATVTITDDDPLVVSLEPAPPGTRISEGAGDAYTFRVGAAGGSRADASVVVTVGGDITLTGSLTNIDASVIDDSLDQNNLGPQFTLTLDTTKAFTVQLNDDNHNEGEERITVELSQLMPAGPLLVFGAVTRVEIVVEASDPMTATLSANAATARETGDANFTVALDGGVPSVGAVVTYDFTVVQNHTSGGVAATIDQHPGRPDIIDRGQGRATIAAGATHGAIVLNIHRDGYEESTETLTLTLTGITAAGAAGLGDATTAAVAISPSGTAFRVLRVSLTGRLQCDDAVPGFIGVPGSPATAGICDLFTQGVRTLPQLTEDGAAIYYEPAGTGGSSGGTFSSPTVQFELLEGAAYSDHQLGLNFQDDAQGAAALGAVPADGDLASGRSGSPETGDGSVGLRINSDQLNEGTETFVVQITSFTDWDPDEGEYRDRGTVIEYADPVSGSFGIAAFRGVILDHPEDTLIASVADAAVTEGATASFTVTLGGATATADTTVPYSVVADAPVNPVAAGEIDAREGVLTIPQGSATGAILVPTAGAANNLNQTTRHFTVQLLPGVASRGAVTRSETALSASGAIADDDDILLESVAPAFDGDAVEGDIAEFVVTASNPSADAWTLRWSASASGGGAAQALQPCSVADLCFVPGAQGRRFVPPGVISAEVTFPAHATTAAFSFLVNQDGVAEARETLVAEINADEVRAGPRSGVITPTLSGGGAASASLHIAANDAAMRFLTAGGASSMRLREGDVASFDVALDGATPTSVVTVRWVVDSDAANDPNAPGQVNLAEPSDYAPASGQLRFTPDNFAEMQTAFITITDDDLNESTETLTVRLFGTMGGVSTDDAAIQVTGTVVMNIRQSDPLTWSLAETPPAEVAESAGDLRYEITLSGRSEGRLTAPLTVTGSATAAAPDDPARDVALPPPTEAVATTATAVFAAGATRTSIALALFDDDEFERPETVIVELPAAAGMGSDARAGFVTRAPRENDYRATTLIRDNDNATITLEGPSAAVAEGGAAAFTVTLAGDALELDVVAPYSVGILQQAGIGGAQNTAANPDFTPGFTPGAATTGALVIAAGTTQTTVTYRIVRDGIAENDEMLRLELLPPPGGNVTVSGNTSATVVIQSVAAPARLSAAPAPGYGTAVAEGGVIAWRIAVAPTGSTTPETLVLHYAVVDGDGNAAGIASDIGFADGRVFGGATRTVVGHVPATQTFIETTPELTVYRDGVLEDAETLFLAVSLGVTGTIPASDQAIETLQMTLPLTDGRVDAPLAIAASDGAANGPPQPLLTTLPAAPENSTAVVVMEGDVL